MSGSPGDPARRPGRALILVQNLTVPFDRRVWLESQALRRAGWQVSVICPTGPPWTKPYEELEGIHIYRYPAPPPTRGVLTYLWEFAYCWLRTAWLTLRVARERGFDVLHACNPPDTFFAIGAVYKLFGKRFLFDQHDLSPEVYESRFGKRGFWYAGLRVLEWLTYATADTVIATNQSYRETAIRRGWVDPRNIFVVRSGPPLSRFKSLPPDPALKRGRPFLVAYLGVMAPQDGVDFLIRAAAVLIGMRGARDVSYTMIGSGDSFDDLVALTKELGLEDVIAFTGRIPDEEVEAILSTADVCVGPDPRNPLNDVSTMNKILEYMAVGRPIVAFDLRETRYSAGDGALYAVPNEVTDLATKIGALLEDPARRAAMGAYNRERFQKGFAWDYSELELVKAYDHVRG
ncbi:MAG: glycosyltransferase family 4 protein [Candidatus Eiseniibacteriota bacterium]